MGEKNNKSVFTEVLVWFKFTYSIKQDHKNKMKKDGKTNTEKAWGERKKNNKGEHKDRKKLKKIIH